MSNDKSLFQEQIILDNVELKGDTHLEQNSSIENDKNIHIGTAIVVDNHAYQKAQEHFVENEEPRIKSKKMRVLWPLTISLIIILIGIELVNFIINHIFQSPIVTGIYITLFICFFVMFCGLFIKEFYGLYQLKKQQHLRVKVSKFIAEPISVSSVKSAKQAKEICEEIHKQLAYDLPQSVEHQWQLALANNINEQELIQIFDLQVLSYVDKKAIADIAKYSSETMLLVAISPLAFIDMLIVLWRNIKMINKISGLYGLKLGYWSRIKLIKQVFSDMLLVGASELALDLGSQAIGADLLGKFSGRIAQGFGAGMLTARLGLNTLKASRPMPFIDEAPQLSHIRNALLSNIKTNIFKNDKSENT